MCLLLVWFAIGTVLLLRGEAGSRLLVFFFLLFPLLGVLFSLLEQTDFLARRPRRRGEQGRSGGGGDERQGSIGGPGTRLVRVAEHSEPPAVSSEDSSRDGG